MTYVINLNLLLLQYSALIDIAVVQFDVQKKFIKM